MFVDLQIIMGMIYKFHELTACYLANQLKGNG